MSKQNNTFSKSKKKLIQLNDPKKTSHGVISWLVPKLCVVWSSYSSARTPLWPLTVPSPGPPLPPGSLLPGLFLADTGGNNTQIKHKNMVWA